VAQSVTVVQVSGIREAVDDDPLDIHYQKGALGHFDPFVGGARMMGGTVGRAWD
jgi:hypothetical protein